MLPLILNALGACATACPEVSGVPPYAMLMRLWEGAATHRFRVGDASSLVTILTSVLEGERERGVYPVTLSALMMCEALFKACSPELFVLPWSSHTAIPLLTVEAAGDGAVHGAAGASAAKSEAEPPGIETLGILLDFSLGLCFARCGFWPCRSPADRWQLALVCIRMVVALLPAMECFD
jgi:hypothetical protein